MAELPTGQYLGVSSAFFISLRALFERQCFVCFDTERCQKNTVHTPKGGYHESVTETSKNLGCFYYSTAA